MALQRDYVRDLAAGARATIDTLDPAPFLAKYGPAGNTWAIAKSSFDAAAEEAAAAVIAKYTGRLAAVDVFTAANEAAMINFTRIDDGVLGPFGVQP